MSDRRNGFSIHVLDGQTARVTRGTHGIGQAMAVPFAEAGANILLVQVCCSGETSLVENLPLNVSEPVERCDELGNKDCS